MQISKKAQGLSMSVIVIAALVLIVLVVVIGIFTVNSGKFSDDIVSCGVRGGICEESCGTNQRQIDAECSEGKQCCLTIFNDEA